MKLRCVGLLILGVSGWGPGSADAAARSSGLPAPQGMKICAPGHPVATAEARLAANLGGEFLGCFQSELKVTATSAGNAPATTIEYAFAIALPGGGYMPADLDRPLSTVKQKWKEFDPLSKEFRKVYTARLNTLIKDNGLTPSPTTLSVRPILVKIDRADANYYVVTSIRTYLFEMNGKQVTSTKVNSDAVALRDSQLIRLTIQRPLTDPADVAQVQRETADWARATVRASQ